MNHSMAVTKRTGQDSGAVSDASRTGRAPGGRQATGPDVYASPLQTVVEGILGGRSPMQFMSGIDAVNRALGNRAFLNLVGALQSVGHGAPLQLMGKKKKKQEAPEVEEGSGKEAAGTERDAGAGPEGTVASGPDAAQPKASGTIPGVKPEPDEGAAGGAKKKKKKGRVQVALNTLRGEGVAAFGEYIEAEIGEAELLRTLVERITRAEDLQSVRAEALATVEARLRLLDPLLPAPAFAEPAPCPDLRHARAGLQPAGARQEPELAVIAPARLIFSLWEAMLFDACVKGDTGRFRRYIIHRNIDVNLAYRQTTLLSSGAYRGHAGIVELLLRRPEIDVNLAQQGGATALHMAAQQGHVEVVRLLLGARGINVNLATLEGATPLYIAAECGWVDVAKMLLGRPDINVNPVTVPNKTTPLSVAAQKGQEEIVKLLLATRGVGLDMQKDDGATALFMAAQIGFTGIVKQLVRRGADINLARDDGMTPLCVAALVGNIEIVKTLLQVPGIQVNLATDNGTIPLGIAAQRGYKDIVRLLLRKGASPNRANQIGVTPLHVACLHGHTASVQILLHAGADTTAKMTDVTGRGYTPYDFAELAGQRGVMSVLAAHRRRRESAPPRLEQLSITGEPGKPVLPPASPETVSPPGDAASAPTQQPPLTSSGEADSRPGEETDVSTRPMAGTESVSQAPVPLAEGVAAGMIPVTTSVVSPSPDVPGSFPVTSEPPSPLALAKHALRQEVLGKFQADNFDWLEGIRLLQDVNDTNDLDSLCVLYNRLAHIERHKERARRRKRRRGLLPVSVGPEPAAADPAAAPVFALGGQAGLDAERVEVEIRRHLGQAYQRFVSQAVNDMEFGRGKRTTGYPGLWHVSAGVAGVGSCSVFYYLEGCGEKIRVVGIGRHVGRAAYRLDYASEELGEAGRVLRIA